ncbi:hypothetical protein F4810DRAFT_51622 [Camillea tinctor]|nr:hypothetical protein F4810DRAFT_51622 [Camillea tinctor]
MLLLHLHPRTELPPISHRYVLHVITCLVTYLLLSSLGWSCACVCVYLCLRLCLSLCLKYPEGEQNLASAPPFRSFSSRSFLALPAACPTRHRPFFDLSFFGYCRLFVALCLSSRLSPSLPSAAWPEPSLPLMSSPSYSSAFILFQGCLVAPQMTFVC